MLTVSRLLAKFLLAGLPLQAQTAVLLLQHGLPGPLQVAYKHGLLPSDTKHAADERISCSIMFQCHRSQLVGAAVLQKHSSQSYTSRHETGAMT